MTKQNFKTTKYKSHAQHTSWKEIQIIEQQTLSVFLYWFNWSSAGPRDIFNQLINRNFRISEEKIPLGAMKIKEKHVNTKYGQKLNKNNRRSVQKLLHNTRVASIKQRSKSMCSTFILELFFFFFLFLLSTWFLSDNGFNLFDSCTYCLRL